MLELVLFFLLALYNDNCDLVWYVPVAKVGLPYKAIRVNLLPIGLIDLIGRHELDVISLIIKQYAKGVRFASIKGDRLLAKLADIGCTFDGHMIYWGKTLVGSYSYIYNEIASWRTAEITEKVYHGILYDTQLTDISTMTREQQSALVGRTLSRKYDLYDEDNDRLYEVKFGQAYIEDIPQ